MSWESRGEESISTCNCSGSGQSLNESPSHPRLNYRPLQIDGASRIQSSENKGEWTTSVPPRKQQPIFTPSPATLNRIYLSNSLI